MSNLLHAIKRELGYAFPPTIFPFAFNIVMITMFFGKEKEASVTAKYR